MYISIILLQHSSKKTVHIVVHNVHNSVDSDKLLVRMDTPVVLIQKPYTFCEKKNVDWGFPRFIDYSSSSVILCNPVANAMFYGF